MSGSVGGPADSRGLTLVEILIALVIISVGLLGLAVVIPVASYGVQEGNQLTTATFLAEQRVEQVRNALWTDTPDVDCLGVGASAAPTIPGGKSCSTTGAATGAVTFPDEGSTAIAGFSGYSRAARIVDCGVTACAGVTDAGMRLVTVTVTYTPGSGGGGKLAGASAKTASVSLLIARR